MMPLSLHAHCVHAAVAAGGGCAVLLLLATRPTKREHLRNRTAHGAGKGCLCTCWQLRWHG